MKKTILKTLLCVGIILSLVGCKNNQEILGENSLDCNNKPKLLLEQAENKIYTYCLDNPKIIIDNKEQELMEYIKNNDDAIDKIINTLEFESSFSDGGTKIYRGKNITLIKCNTLDGNRDIYIGDEKLEFKQNFCDNNNYTFVRTYKIKNVEEYNQQQYTEDGIPVSYGNSFEVTLEQFQGETETVIINNIWDIKLEKEKVYEFELMLYEDHKEIEDNIKYIFKNSNIIDIRETNKVGLEQLQEEIKFIE